MLRLWRQPEGVFCSHNKVFIILLFFGDFSYISPFAGDGTIVLIVPSFVSYEFQSRYSPTLFCTIGLMLCCLFCKQDVKGSNTVGVIYVGMV